MIAPYTCFIIHGYQSLIYMDPSDPPITSVRSKSLLQPIAKLDIQSVILDDRLSILRRYIALVLLTYHQNRHPLAIV